MLLKIVFLVVVIYALVETGSAQLEFLQYRVTFVERVERPLTGCPNSGSSRGKRSSGSSHNAGLCVFPHAGVRVTTANGNYLIHKGNGYGDWGQTVAVEARNMGSEWTVVQSKSVSGRQTISNYIAVGGRTYNLLSDNCLGAARRMYALN